MTKMVDIDLSQVARELGLNLDSVQNTVELLDDGNTVPFITRYRKELTGALDEEQIRRIREKVVKMRALAERKATILKSIQSQEKLTPSLSEQIQAADSAKRLEDLYLPFKPKKQTLATTARQRGLEPLAREVVDADPATAELTQRAADFVSAENGLAGVEDVLSGVGHIIAELFSERADVRGRLRKILHRTGKLVCSRLDATRREPTATPEPPAVTTETHDTLVEEQAELTVASDTAAAAEQTEVAHGPADAEQPVAPATTAAPEAVANLEQPGSPDEAVTVEPVVVPEGELPSESTNVAAPPVIDEQAVIAEQAVVSEPGAEPPGIVQAPRPDVVEPTAEDSGPRPVPDETPPEHAPPATDAAVPIAGESSDEPTPTDSSAGDVTPPNVAQDESTPSAPPVDAARPSTATAPRRPVIAVAAVKSSRSAADTKSAARSTKKQKKRQKLEAAFKDYFEFQEPISKIPPHRILAINRGERAKILRVKLEADVDAVFAEAEKMLVPADHPHADFLRSCVRDALGRLLIPSLEREVRREMTERAEEHAVDVFVQNLRKLLLQPPVHGHRVLAVDPGFRSGCKLMALDEFGRVLGHEIVHVIGKDSRVHDGRKKLSQLVRNHQLSVVAIGNGTACRETEQFVVDVMENELKDVDLSFVIVNEAGASVYSTSPLGREELPGFDAVLRSAISIGRRLLDPLSELVKINPANIGVGMYQHDVKAKHLRESLDAVVESCVNYVGVDVNTASPALLKYVSGLNQLTARRLCEYRHEHGPFRNREQFREVPGFGEATFVQSAGFLKITNGDNPLDSTWIHPESYDLAWKVLEMLGCTPAEFAQGIRRTSPMTAPVEVADIPAATMAEASDALPSTSVPAPAVEEPAAAEPESLTPPEEISPAVPPPPEAEQAAVATPDAALPSVDLAAGTELPSTSVPAPAVEDPAAAEPLTPGSKGPSLSERAALVDREVLSSELATSTLLLNDILGSLARPGRDPREDLPPPVFRRGIVKLEDLEPGMQMSGTVLNVVDFGAFVDIGLPDSGLVHISRLADRFVRDPHEVVGVGDVIAVWVVEVDKPRRRVSLTAIKPGTETPPQDRPGRGRQRRTEPKPEVKRRPRSGGRPDGKSQRVPPPKHRTHQQASQRPKVVKPITKEMAEGKEPLRSFSDLIQFYQKKQTDEDQSES